MIGRFLSLNNVLQCKSLAALTKKCVSKNYSNGSFTNGKDEGEV